MNRKVLFNAIGFFVNIVAIVSIITILIVYKTDIDGYYITLWILMALSIFNVVLIGFKEYFVKEYHSGKYTLAMHATYCVINCGSYYLVKYADGYESFFYLYWLLSYLGTIVVVIMFLVFNKHVKDDKPKFRVNR
ncbi:MAG: hypothetical protein IKP77_03920 [Acholeplasmatales bacterium]|nr:hypothetical protein [Acholeplasmatales bacterium]